MIVNLRHLVMARHHARGNLRPRNTRLKIKPSAPNRKVELWYKVELLRVTRLLAASKARHLLPVLKQYRGQYEYIKKDAATVRDAAYSQALQDALDAMAGDFGGIQRTANRLAELAVQKASGAADEAFKKNIMSAVGIDISPFMTSGGAADQIELALKANVNLITSIPAQYFDKVEQAVWTGVSQGQSYDTIAESLTNIDGVTDSRAKLIARDQVSKINGAITQERQTSVGIEKYTWSTSMDERVRDSHADKEGEVFSWDDPPEDTGHPGEDINCRCVAIPYIDLDQEEEDAGIGPDDDDDSGAPGASTTAESEADDE